MFKVGLYMSFASLPPTEHSGYSGFWSSGEVTDAKDRKNHGFNNYNPDPEQIANTCYTLIYTATYNVVDQIFKSLPEGSAERAAFENHQISYTKRPFELDPSAIWAPDPELEAGLPSIVYDKRKS